MTDPLRITGFMRLALEVVTREPGLTAKEVYLRVSQLAQMRGIPISASVDPEGSLKSTLHKVHADYGMKRHRGADGRYRYYPAE